MAHPFSLRGFCLCWGGSWGGSWVLWVAGFVMEVLCMLEVIWLTSFVRLGLGLCLYFKGSISDPAEARRLCLSVHTIPDTQPAVQRGGKFK